MVAAAAGSALVWFLGLLTASVSLLVGNKFVAQSYSANNLTILFQNGVAALILYAGARAGRFDMKPLKEGQFRAMAVPALLNSLQLLTSIKALPYVAIATTVVFRNVSTLLCAGIESAYFGETFSARAKAALVLIFLGSVVYAKQDLTFNFVGYMWLCGNTAAYTVNNIYTKLTVTKMEQTGSGIALVTTLLTLPMFLGYAVYFGEIPQGIYDLGGLSAPVIAVFLFLGLMGTLISMSCEFFVLLKTSCFGFFWIFGRHLSLFRLLSFSHSFYPPTPPQKKKQHVFSADNNLYKLVSATSVVVAANMNKVAAILLAFVVFKKALSSTQMLGLCMCMAGGIAYGVQTKRDKAAAKAAKATQSELTEYEKVATEDVIEDSEEA